MPVVTVREARRTAARFENLVRKATEKASDLLRGSDRVLVVYEKGSACIYYEDAGVSKNLPPLV